MKEIAFLTGTRADYGKIKSLLKILNLDPNYRVQILATGMHLLPKYGETITQVTDDSLGVVHLLPNQMSDEQPMEISLARTIERLSEFLDKNSPDLLVVHGDRIEALAGAIAGSIRNIPVAHIEGGEVSGTIDGLIRHSISKLAHLHFVSNESAKSRLLQLGEESNSIHIIGSPDIDVMFSENLPTIEEVKKRYDIGFQKYAIVTFHPITTELSSLNEQVTNLTEALNLSDYNYVVIKPNNDRGSEVIQEKFELSLHSPRFKHLPSMRFEYFLTLMKESHFLIGNSSAGVRESSYYGVPSINIGTRQRNRQSNQLIVDSPSLRSELLSAISKVDSIERKPIFPFGNGNSAELFKSIIDNEKIWPISTDKIFIDLQ